MEFLDYYATLGVAPDASRDEIKKAYRSLALKWHPDRHQGAAVKEAEERFKRIAEAHDVLSDEDRRKKYDALRSAHRDGTFTAPPGAGFQGMSPEDAEAAFGFSDFFAQFFGRRPSQEDTPRRHARFRHRGADARALLELPVTLAIQGGRQTFQITARVACSACGGTGLSTADRVCLVCAGVGRIPKDREVTVKIPPGIREGQSLRLAGLGEPGVGGGEAGDLHLEIAWASDDLYTVDGDDLVGELPLAPWEFIEGASVDVGTPWSHVTLRVPEKTRAGSRLRIRGHGLPRPDGTRGDLMVQTRMALPNVLTSEQRELLKKAGQQGESTTGGLRQ